MPTFPWKMGFIRFLIFRQHFRYPELFERVLLPYISHSCHFEQKKAPFQTWSQKIVPRRQKLFIKMELHPALKNARTMITCNRVRFLLGLSVLEIRHPVFWKKSEMNNVDIQRGASSPKFITEIPSTPVRARWRTGQNS